MASELFNQTCINEEMLPKYTHTHIYTDIYWMLVVCLGAFEFENNLNVCFKVRRYNLCFI